MNLVFVTLEEANRQWAIKESFIYKVIKRYSFVDAHLVHKIYRSSSPGLPVAAYEKEGFFRLYMAMFL